MARKLAETAARRGHVDHASYFLRVAHDAERRAERLRRLALDRHRVGRLQSFAGGRYRTTRSLGRVARAPGGPIRAPVVQEDGLTDESLAYVEFDLWHVYHTDGLEARLRVRYRYDDELPDWRLGPDLATALRRAEAQGWHAYDSEPGDAPGEHAIIHLKRIVSR